jgi:hypothetical protein
MRYWVILNQKWISILQLIPGLFRVPRSCPNHWAIYTILLEDLLGKKKWSQKNGGFRPLLTPFPWQLFRISHGNYYWPCSDLSPLQFPHTLVFWKNFRFLLFCLGFVVFSRWFESIFKIFSIQFFLNLVIGSKMCKSYVLFFPGKTTKSKPRTEYEQRAYLNQRAINRYFIQFYLCFYYILSHIKLVGLT